MQDSGVDQANRESLKRVLAANPVLIDVVPACEAIPGLEPRVVLHAGPPLDWQAMCGPLQGAVLGACVYEGWTKNRREARRLAEAGRLTFHPNHHFGAVGPMTGIITRSMPVFVVENGAFGNRAYCTINEGLGNVMRFGANDRSVIARLKWLESGFAPLLQGALRAGGPIPLSPLVARALAMGDEMHQRNVAATALFAREIFPRLAGLSVRRSARVRAVEFLTGNDQFFLNLAMAAAKAGLDPAGDVAGSTLVTCMSRNGSDFGIRVSGLGKRWVTAPVEMPRGLYFPGFGPVDANPDIGDSAILETWGIGGFAMAAAPAVVGFVGAGEVTDALRYTREMGEITIGRNPAFPLPALDFAGTPTGIDVRKVVKSGIRPVINTGIAHRSAGRGQVGAGIAHPPMACFTRALEALDALVSSRSEGAGQVANRERNPD
ncbi:MAG: DUF1116 domain-containing protein [Nitrospinota bacterium]|nr:DUF1116 domain-containing protein [Nitrospinota bacterium]